MDVVKSYAKINLGLSVVKKTKKNYHKLKMVMSQIELYDEICFSECNELIVLSDKQKSLIAIYSDPSIFFH